MSTYKRIAAVGLVAVVALALAAPVLAKKPSKPSKTKKAKQAVTRIDFHLDDHSVAPGEAVTGTVSVSSRDRKESAAVPGASLDITLDGVAVATVVTDADGVATVALSSPDLGEHVIKVAYAGNETHKKAQRAQGFEVTTTPDVDEVEDVDDGTGL